MKNIAWLRCLVKSLSLSSLVIITLLSFGQHAEATVITYYFSEQCPICAAFEPAWNEFAANETGNYTIKKKSVMNADNLQELAQITQNATGNVSPSTPSIYIELDNNPPVLLIGPLEVQSLYQVIEPGTAKTISFVIPAQLLPRPVETSNTSFLIPITLAAAADAVNPCAIFVFILAVSYATIYSGKRKAILYGVTFTAALYLTYFAAGIVGKVAINRIFSNINNVALIMSGGLFIIAGFHMRTVLFPEKTMFSELSDSAKRMLIKHAQKCISVSGAAISGVLCAMIWLPCTGGPYAFALSLLAKYPIFKAALWLAYYNLIFIFPILILLGLVMISPEKVEIFEQIRNKYRQLLHLVMALFLIAAGAWGIWHYYISIS